MPKTYDREITFQIELDGEVVAGRRWFLQEMEAVDLFSTFLSMVCLLWVDLHRALRRQEGR